MASRQTLPSKDGIRTLALNVRFGDLLAIENIQPIDSVWRFQLRILNGWISYSKILGLVDRQALNYVTISIHSKIKNQGILPNLSKMDSQLDKEIRGELRRENADNRIQQAALFPFYLSPLSLKTVRNKRYPTNQLPPQVAHVT
jgi:hypothetical protein